ncbi:hypothetical protein NEPAR07_1621 [Nematocida parisii]|nr:hypothetical protein NEPAR07_1621 [Nematocida parisii]
MKGNRLNFTIIIIIAILNITKQVYGDDSMSLVKNAQHIKIKVDSGYVYINPDGSLNLLRGYIIDKMGLIHNIRDFTPDLDIKYTVSPDTSEGSEWTSHILTRIRDEDRPLFKEFENGIKDIYLNKYYIALINLFPFIDKDMPIETPNEDSFIRFLRSKDVLPNMQYVLAAILLITEGVNINIDVSDDQYAPTLTIKRKNNIEYMSTSLNIKKSVRKSREDKWVCQRKTIELIEFFKTFVSAYFLYKENEFAEPITLEQFKSGKFLNNPGFLIQTFIYYVLKTEEGIKGFYNAVHKMLSNHIKDTIDSSDTTHLDAYYDVYNKLFIHADDNFYIPSTLSYINALESIPMVLKKEEVLPFSNTRQIPDLENIIKNSNISCIDKSVKIHLLQVENNMTLSILGIVCCLLYNPKECQYIFTREQYSLTLINFFQNYMRPFQSIGVSAYNEWSNICMSIMKNKKVFADNNNKIYPGLLNMLYSLVDILEEDVKEVVMLDGFIQKACKSKFIEDKEFYRKLNKYLTKLFRRMSVNSYVMVAFENVKKVHKNNRYDLHGKLTILYTYIDNQKAISIDISDNGIGMIPSKTITPFYITKKKEILDLTYMYREKDNFTACLVTHYIECTANDVEIKLGKNNSEGFIKEVKNQISTGFKNINSLLVMRKIDCLWYKKQIITAMLINSCDSNREITKIAPLIRFLSNIIGSCDLSKPDVLKEIICRTSFINNYDKIFPHIQINQRLYEIINCTTDIETITTVLLSIIENKLPGLLLSCIEKYMQENSDTENRWFNQIFKSYSKQIYECFLEYNSIVYLNALSKLMVDSGYTDKIIEIVNVISLVYACESKSISPSQINQIYNNISIKCISTLSDIEQYLEIETSYKKVTEMLSDKKKEVHKGSEVEKEKLNKLISLFKLK